MRALLSHQKLVILQWIPSHCGIAGNEIADQLAKKGTNIPPFCCKLNYNRAKTVIHHKVQDEHHQTLEDLTKASHWREALKSVPDWPRKEAVAKFRLATGHDCLAKHLHRIGILQTPDCPLCSLGKIMDARHLQECPALLKSTLTEKYWEAREKMSLL